MEQLMAIPIRTLQRVLNSGRDTRWTVWDSKAPSLKGTEASLSCVQCFLYLVFSSINVSIFHILCLDTFWLDLIYHILCRVFWQNMKSPRWLSLLQPTFGALWLLAFPKTEISFEMEEISDCQRFRKIWWGSWWRLAELCEVPRCLLWRGLRHHCPVYNVFVSYSIIVSISHSAWLDTFWTA